MRSVKWSSCNCSCYHLRYPLFLKPWNHVHARQSLQALKMAEIVVAAAAHLALKYWGFKHCFILFWRPSMVGPRICPNSLEARLARSCLVKIHRERELPICWNTYDFQHCPSTNIDANLKIEWLSDTREKEGGFRVLRSQAEKFYNIPLHGLPIKLVLAMIQASWGKTSFIICFIAIKVYKKDTVYKIRLRNQKESGVFNTFLKLSPTNRATEHHWRPRE